MYFFWLLLVTYPLIINKLWFTVFDCLIGIINRDYTQVIKMWNTQIPSGTDSRMTRFEWHTLGLPTVTCVQYRWIPGGHWAPIVLQTNTVWEDHYRRPTQGWQRSHNFKSFEGPVLNCRDGTHPRGEYLNELVIGEIRNNASAIFQKFLFSCCKIEFVHLW